MKSDTENKQDTANDILDYIRTRAEDVDKAMTTYLNDKTSPRHLERLLGRSGYEYDPEAIDKSIIEPAKYLLHLGGKRWRPVLMLTIIDALGKDSNDYLEFAVIPEIIHNATLIHDDIEDGSEMRRGAQAVHVKFGLDIGLNLGDFMFYFPIVALLDSKKINDVKKMRILEIYQRNMLKVTIGQATDIAWHNLLVNPFEVSEKKYLQMAYAKSGVLPEMAASFGGVLGDADEKTIKALAKFGGTIGVAFQLQDDVLNIVESGVSETKGGVGDDITEGKLTMLVIYTIANASKADKEKLIEILNMHTKDQKIIKEAIDIIKKYKAIEFVNKLEEKLVVEAWGEVDKLLHSSDAKNKLKALAEFVIARSI